MQSARPDRHARQTQMAKSRQDWTERIDHLVTDLDVAAKRDAGRVRRQLCEELRELGRRCVSPVARVPRDHEITIRQSVVAWADVNTA
jgi:hypothetical protein